jgi:hypothetical protein
MSGTDLGISSQNVRERCKEDQRGSESLRGLFKCYKNTMGGKGCSRKSDNMAIAGPSQPPTGALLDSALKIFWWLISPVASLSRATVVGE